jgi:hypothetical protein
MWDVFDAEPSNTVETLASHERADERAKELNGQDRQGLIPPI